MSSIGPRNYSIQEAKADQTYSKSGEQVSKGKSTKRLILSNDSRLNIAVSGKLSSNPIIGVFQSIYNNLRHVKLKVGDDNIYVNVNSLAKRLHLSKSDIRAAAQEGKLDQLIEAKTPHLSRILDEYRDLFASYKHERELEKETGVSAKTLMKTVSAAMPKLISDRSEKTIESEQTFTARLDTKGHLRLTFIAKKLGAGTFGIVSKSVTLGSVHKEEDAFGNVINDGSQRIGALKIAKNSERAKIDVVNEYKMLKFLHSPGPNDPPTPSSIQAKPHRFAIITASSGQQIGYEGEIYQGDLDKASSEPIRAKLQRGLSMMEGVAYLHARGVVHKDIKRENFLVKDNTTVVSDLGGARLIADFAQSQSFELGSHTPAFTNLRAVLDAENQFYAHDIKGMEDSLKKNDAFSTAATLYELFTGELPYSFGLIAPNGQSYPNPQKFTDAQKAYLERQGVPKDIINLLDEMLNGPTPTMSEAYERYKAAFSSLNYFVE